MVGHLRSGKPLRVSSRPTWTSATSRSGLTDPEIVGRDASTSDWMAEAHAAACAQPSPFVLGVPESERHEFGAGDCCSSALRKAMQQAEGGRWSGLPRSTLCGGSTACT